MSSNSLDYNILELLKTRLLRTKLYSKCASILAMVFLVTELRRVMEMLGEVEVVSEEWEALAVVNEKSV